MSAITVASAAATAATTPTAAAAATTSAASVTTAAATTASTSRLTLAGLVDGERTAVERLAIELGDGGLSIFVVRKLDEGEASRLTRHPIGHDADADDFTAASRASLAK
jgi:hypothetical protein